MLRNSLVEGFTSTVNNTADFTLYVMSLGGIGVSPEYDAASNQEKARIFSETLDDIGIKKTLDKQLRAASTTPEYTQKRTEEGGPIMEGVVGLAGSAFPMLTPQQSGFFINGFVDSKKEIQEAMPDLSPWKQAAYAFTQGAVQVALERAGLSNLAQNKSVTRALSGKVMDAMKTTFGKFTAKEADAYATKVVNAFFAEGETGATQYFVSEGIRQLADALEGDDDKFEFEGGEEFILNIMKSGVSEGVGGVIMKSMAELPKLIKSPLKKKEAAAVNAQTEQLAADIQNPNVSPEAKVAIDKQINDNAEDVAKAYAEDLNKYEALSEESRADLNRINEDIISHEAVLNDPNVSPETKAISEQRIQELEEQGEGILDSAPAPKPTAPVAESPTEQAPVAEQASPQEKGEFSIQGTFDGLRHVVGDPANEIPDVQKGDMKTTLSESNQKGKKIFTLNAPQADNVGRMGYLSVSLVFPETTTKTIDDVKTALENKMAEAKAIVNTARDKGINAATDLKNKVSAEYSEPTPTPTEQPAPQTLPEVENAIADLRKQEEAENEETYDKYDEAITPLLEQEKELKAQAPVAEEAKGESGVEENVVNKDYSVSSIFIEKINPDGENTALTERQEGSIEKAVQMAIDAGQTAEQIAGTLNGLGYAFRNPLGMRAAQQTLINYIENRINGTDTRNINEFAKDTKAVEQSIKQTPKSKQAPVAEEAKGEVIKKYAGELRGLIRARLRKEGKSEDEISKLTGTATSPILDLLIPQDITSLLNQFKQLKVKQLENYNKYKDRYKPDEEIVPEIGEFISKDTSFYDSRIAELVALEQTTPTSEQAPQPFPAQEGATAAQEQEFKANPELEQVYRDLNAAVTKNVDKDTIRMLKEKPTEAMVEKALRELQKKGIINIEC
jgi:hypothetical protein